VLEIRSEAAETVGVFEDGQHIRFAVRGSLKWKIAVVSGSGGDHPKLAQRVEYVEANAVVD
jgi:hypothetical protein